MALAFVSQASKADTVLFEDDFAPQQPGWSFATASAGLLGPLNDNANVSGVELSLVLPTREARSTLLFDLIGFGTLDGTNRLMDTLTFSVNGQLAFSGTWTRPDDFSAFDVNPGVATVGSAKDYVADAGTGWSRTFSMAVNLNAGTNVFRWSYSPLQPISDEAWGLDNVRVSVVPEPDGLWLFAGGGLAMVALLQSRRVRGRRRL